MAPGSLHASRLTCLHQINVARQAHSLPPLKGGGAAMTIAARMHAGAVALLPLPLTARATRFWDGGERKSVL